MVTNRTLANLSKLLEALRGALRGDPLVPFDGNGFVARRIGLEDLLPRRAASRRRDLALGLIVAGLLDPAAKLAAARMLDSVTAREIYATLDWRGSEQTFIETCLARRHLKDGTLVVYDVTSTWKDAAGRWPDTATAATAVSGQLQLVIGLLCASDGGPVAVEVFEGNTDDPTTVAAQIARLKQHFRLRHVVLVLHLSRHHRKSSRIWPGRIRTSEFPSTRLEAKDRP